ncbi:uncharacterized protein LOC126849515 [Cataglyphis hispanica]|uniref:uncharacterized protein LOC126849515 n=1 Tax=Cataglyphis hispanica TaxID=1086592 RepID=UPI00217F2B82|nr:uncharacterized protein LOC126849515 [Cataglyphis hispanica]
MSRRIFHRCLLFYVSVSAILLCGSSRRIPRSASCPSCSRDCPEALTVQLPWNLDEDSNLQPRVLRDFPVNSLRNSRRSNLIQEGISQGTTYDNILPSQNLVSLKSFSPQETTSRNLFFKNFLNKFPKFSDRQEIFSQDRSANRYPLAHVLPSIFRSENVFRNPRNKYSSTLLDRSFENNIKDKKDSTNKMLDVYRADRDTEPLNSRYVSSSNIISPQRFSPKIENIFRFHRDPIPHIFDEKRNAIGKSPRAIPINQQYSLAYPRKGYNSILPEIKHDPYVHPLENINTWKPTKNDGFFDNWDEKIKDSSQSLNVEQSKQAENNFLEMYPAKEQEINIEDNNEQINKSYILPHNLDSQEQTDDGENFDDWDYAAYKNSQESTKINQLKETGNNWLQVFPAMERNIKYFENEKDTDKKFAEQENINQGYFEDEIVQDALETEQSKYNPYTFSQNMNNWRTIQNKEFFDNLDFTHKNSPKTDQLEMYSEENNDKFFQNLKNKDITLKSKTQASDDRASMLNAYILPRHLNILNDAKYSVDSSEIQKIPEAKNNILRANPMEENNEKFFMDEDIIQNNAAIQDLILSKDIFDMDEYSSHNVDKKNTRNTQVLTRIDPDLLDDIEDLPLEPTESTSMESLAEFSTPK